MNSTLKKKKTEAILESLKAGTSFTKACKAAEVDTSTFWLWRQADKRLNEKVLEVLDSRTQIVEDALFKSALGGNITAQIFWLKNRAPDRWKDRYEGQVSGEIKLKPLRVIIRNSGKNDK